MPALAQGPTAPPAVRLDELGAVIFDMDGVVTDTASVHAEAWKRLFDAYLEERSRRTDERFRPFDIDRDYRAYVDGKPRYDGVRDFLRSRDIALPEGEPGDPLDRETVRGLGNRKDRYFLEDIARDGVSPYPGTLRLVRALHGAGVGVAIISASRNLGEVINAAGVADLFDVRLGGIEAEHLGLPGKPDPAVFLEAARRLGVKPSDAAVIEDALAGVEAGRRGGFRLVVGVDRTGHAEELRARGADVVVCDPGELLTWREGRPGGAAPVGSPEPSADPAWIIEVVGFDPLDEREVESWFTVANGRTGTRGSVEEGSEESDPATYVAGLYGSSEHGHHLVSGPDWTGLRPRVNDEVLDLDHGDTLEHRRLLDLRQGALFRFWRQRLHSGGEATFRSVRFASLADRRLLVLDASLASPSGAGRLQDGIPPPPDSGALERVDTRLEVDASVVSIWGRNGGTAAFAIGTEERGGHLTRIVAVARASGGEIAPAEEAELALQAARERGVTELLDRHRAAWLDRWRDADVVVEGDLELQRALRFGLYHLISSADPESDLVSVGARGLSGSGYNGHVFWDTDVFILPFFAYTHPQSARTLLAYRYRTLDAARARAAALGHRGALFAWESADTGEDVTPTEAIGPDGELVRILTGEQEHHIAGDVAWAVWRYWEATGDDEFLAQMGAEIVLETARFWASRARRGDDGRYHVDLVIGPDEYHESVHDNAFTNVLARWNIERALEVGPILRQADPALWEDLSSRLDLTQAELREWKAVVEGLVDGFDPKTLLYEQFRGFFRLEDVRAADVTERPFAGDVVLGPERVDGAQVVKQADVVMLVHMLPELVTRDVADANYRYYEPRTSHGSSLSPAIHAAVAARVGRLQDSVAYSRMAASIDLGNGMGNAAQGVHVATMGGLWQAAVMGFGGVRASRTALHLDPVLPEAWSALRFPVRWHGTRLVVSITADALSLELEGALELVLGTNQQQHLEAGRYQAQRVDGTWSAAEVVR